MSKIKLDLCKLFNVEEEEEFELTFDSELCGCDKVIYAYNKIYKVVNNTLLYTLKGQDYYTKSYLPCYLLTSMVSVKKVHILSPEEKDYLESVIYPVRDKFIEIRKISLPLYNDECLCIRVKYDDYTDDMYLYNFKFGTEYKGMIQECPYTLKDLGLFQD